VEGNGGGVFLGWEQVAAELRHDIISSAIPPGVILASREVGARHGCTTQVARKAMRTLEGEGLLRDHWYGRWRTGTADPAADARMGTSLARLRQAIGLDINALAATAVLHPSLVTDVESGTWQPRGIWERLDAALGADGTLLKLHDSAYAPRPGPPRARRPAGGHLPASPASPHRYAWVTTEIRATIASGEWLPGTRLRQQPLADEHGTHVGAIRAALFDLAAEGLVTHHDGEGFRIPGEHDPGPRATLHAPDMYRDLYLAVPLAGNRVRT
jgi:DNA-binding FadR family transcriptional regulator